MAETINFTKQTLAELPPAQSGKVYEVRDAKVPGLILRVTAAGGKTFYFYRWTAGKATRHLIGKFPAFTHEQARQRAREMTGTIAMGIDPTVVPTPPTDLTLDEVFNWWERTHGARKKTIAQDRKMYDLHLAALGPRYISKITRTDVRELHARMADHRYGANRVLSLLRAVLNKAIADEVIPGPNPAAGIKAYPERSRDRRLSLTEAQALFKALLSTDSQALRDYVLLSLFTGARRGNLCAMAWADIDMEACRWTIPETKNGRPIVVPLLAEEMAILKARKAGAAGPWVFPGRAGATGHLVEPKKGWAALIKRAGIGDLRIHDLRRSLGSFMVDSGASLEVIGKTLGHQSQAATAIYARLSLEPIKEAKARAIAAMSS